MEEEEELDSGIVCRKDINSMFSGHERLLHTLFH